MSVITCPSGLSVRIRGMKVREERILTDRKLAKSGSQVDQLLAACCEEALEPGPYVIGEHGKLDWGKVLQGDRFYALLQIRTLTYGPKYAFAVHCKHCRDRIDWEFNLTDLPVRPLSEESRAAFLAGNRFETKLPKSGKRLWFRLLIGDEERKLPTIQRNNPERALSAGLAFRIVEIEGAETRDKRKFLDELEMPDADFLLSEFERVDCGIDTSIDVECQSCFATQEVELPFDIGFFLPGRNQAAKRRARSESSPT